MNNIDILEDYIELIEKGYCEDCNELCNISTAPAYPSKAVAQAISTLIAENKELKEKNKKIKQEYINPNKARISYFDYKKRTNVVIEGFIPKSKVEEIIHNNKPHIAQEKLQSLLGKE